MTGMKRLTVHSSKDTIQYDEGKGQTQCRMYIEAKQAVLGGPGLKEPPNL